MGIDPMITRRRLLGATLAAAPLALVAACGGASPPTATSPPKPAATSTPAAPLAATALTPATAPTQAATATSPSAAPPAPTAPTAATAATPAPAPTQPAIAASPTAATPAATGPAAATPVPTLATTSTAPPAPPTAQPKVGQSLGPTAAPPKALPPTPACADADGPTPAQTEGPYYTPNTPRRTSLLEPGMAGTRLTLSGRVLSTTCAPIGQALLDFWQADDRGEYDNRGFRLRGHQLADDQGRYQLETVLPGLYPGRTRHIHVRAQAPNRPILTSQLYFPNEPTNARDSIFNQKLVVKLQDGPGGSKLATFDFVLNVG